MGLPINYADLAKRHGIARKFGNEITTGNRCALVMGKALRLTPGKGVETFRGQPSAKPEVRNMPLLSTLFVKATDVALATLQTYGSPSVNVPGWKALDAIAGKRGVIYLEDCWQTGTEKLYRMLAIHGGLDFPSRLKSGDHIDLWDGSVLEIYRDEPAALNLIKLSGKVWLWEAMPG